MNRFMTLNSKWNGLYHEIRSQQWSGTSWEDFLKAARDIWVSTLRDEADRLEDTQ